MKLSIKRYLSFIAALLLLVAITIPALAQSELTLRVNKDFGYNAGKNIRGTFTLSASGPQDLASVVFLLDGKEIGEASAAPFELQINTSNYPSGDHELSARGQRTGGSTLESSPRDFRFVSREEEASGMKNILIPMIGVIALITIGGFAIQMLSARGARGASPVPGGKSAYRGGWGAVCPRCGMPTNIHIFGLNMGIMTKFDRCDNCGRWGLMRVRPAREMEVYARALVNQDQPQVQPESEEEKLRRQLDNSRYTE